MKGTVVCIGRQYGSGGREIGQKLAQRLGVTCYDKLLIQSAAPRPFCATRAITSSQCSSTRMTTTAPDASRSATA